MRCEFNVASRYKLARCQSARTPDHDCLRCFEGYEYLLDLSRTPISMRSPIAPTLAPKLLIVYHSRTGGTQQMVESLAASARQEQGVDVVIKPAAHATAADILNGDGFVFATPEYLGSMSGIMKDMFDRTYYSALDSLEGRPYAIAVCAGSDGQGAARQIERIVTGWRLKPVAEPVIVNVAAQTPERILAQKQLNEAQLAPCSALGALFAAGLTMGLF